MKQKNLWIGHISHGEEIVISMICGFTRSGFYP